MTEFSYLYLFLLSAFLGFELIARVPVILHTPLMSATNFIHGIIFIGSVAVAVNADSPFLFGLSLVSLLFSTLNVVGGFAVTDRMLEMFKTGKRKS